jgi:hypothetical protein
MTMLHADPFMSEREKVCATNWLAAAIDAEDPALAAYWQEQGLEARLDRLGRLAVEPPWPEYKPSKEKPLPVPCDLCRSIKCKNSSCLL